MDTKKNIKEERDPMYNRVNETATIKDKIKIKK